MQEITLKLSVQEIQVLVNGLAELPYKTSAPLIQKLIKSIEDSKQKEPVKPE